jgi:hypothetical protein
LKEIFRKLVNTQNDGHLDLFLGGLFLFIRFLKSSLVDVAKQEFGVILDLPPMKGVENESKLFF